jgi:putative phosphoribosyl transferase
MLRYRDRRDAGAQLAAHLAPLDLDRPVVLALPRGGVPVGYEVARALGAPLEVLVARKLGAPGHPELGIGAIAEGLDEPVVTASASYLRVTADQLRELVARERTELERRVRHYRGDRPLPDLAGRDVVVVDDGLATGVTAEAALRALRTRGPGRLVLAAPVGAPEAAEHLGRVADLVVCPHLPPAFRAVGMWYERFDQTSDEEVLELLAAARVPASGAAVAGSAAGAPLVLEEAAIPQGDGTVVHGDLDVPDGARGAVVFAHGSGSSRHSGRNRQVAATLQAHGFATLLLDLLTEAEELAERTTRHLRFDIDLLADRLGGAFRWLATVPAARDLPVGCFGASTGGAAALVAAARHPHLVAAVVSRGGRPDLAGDHLPAVRAPTLLIVGGADEVVLDLNRQAAGRLTARHRLVVVPGAGHLFEEPGALEQVAVLAAGWFAEHLAGGAPPPAGSA